ncbi:MAG: site-2 protease family protein, partial [bacterium]|nr:site-2 protease family protein [bacterium]
MSILIVIIGIAVLILVHELGHFLVAKIFKVKVEEFGFGFPPRLFAKKRGETTYSFNLLPLGGFVRLLGESPDKPITEDEKPRSFSHQKIWKRSAIIVAGVVMNFILGWLIIAALFFFGSGGPVGITLVAPNSPAEMAGLQIGDLIMDFNKADDFIKFVDDNRGQEVAINVRRGAQDLVVRAVPRSQISEGEGALGVGVAQTGFPRLGFWASLGSGFITSVTIIWAILLALINLVVSVFTGSAALDNFVGPIGLFQVASQAGQLGLVYVLQLVSLISLNLAVLNIFPFP